MYKLVITDKDNKVLLEDWNTSKNRALRDAKEFLEEDRAAKMAYIIAENGGTFVSLTPYKLRGGEIVEI